MYEFISVRGNSVRMRTGLVTIDFKVVIEGTKKRVIAPPNIYLDNHRILIAKVLEAYEQAYELANDQELAHDTVHSTAHS